MGVFRWIVIVLVVLVASYFILPTVGFYGYFAWKYLAGPWKAPDVQRGDRFVITEPMEIEGLVYWYAPYTDGFRCTVAAGTELIALDDGQAHQHALSFFFANEAMEPRCVEASTMPKYQGYQILIDYKELDKRLKKLPPDA